MKKERWLLILIVTITILIETYCGYLYGVKTTESKNRQLVNDTFAQVKDCLIQVNYSGYKINNGKHWTVSDMQLHQDWEKNGHRRCDVEVGEALYKYLETNSQVERN